LQEKGIQAAGFTDIKSIEYKVNYTLKITRQG
jgi:hypothetical protein